MHCYPSFWPILNSSRLSIFWYFEPKSRLSVVTSRRDNESFLDRFSENRVWFRWVVGGVGVFFLGAITKFFAELGGTRACNRWMVCMFAVSRGHSSSPGKTDDFRKTVRRGSVSVARRICLPMRHAFFVLVGDGRGPPASTLPLHACNNSPPIHAPNKRLFCVCSQRAVWRRSMVRLLLVNLFVPFPKKTSKHSEPIFGIDRSVSSWYRGDVDSIPSAILLASLRSMGRWISGSRKIALPWKEWCRLLFV